jgi:TusA-related sulfurtransferase
VEKISRGHVLLVLCRDIQTISMIVHGILRGNHVVYRNVVHKLVKQNTSTTVVRVLKEKFRDHHMIFTNQVQANLTQMNVVKNHQGAKLPNFVATHR